MKKKVRKKEVAAAKVDKRLAKEELKEITYTCPTRGKVTEQILVKVYHSGNVLEEEPLEIAEPSFEESETEDTYGY
jgi:hypothetical protein